MIPGEIITGDDEHVLNDGLPVTTIAVANRGDRPIQVGSHYHFAETNAALLFDRTAAYGQRLATPSGRSEGRSGGQEYVRTCESRGAQDAKKKKKKRMNI